MWKVEFHCHTMYSKDSLVHPSDLIKACEKKGIDRLVITDHNTIQGALAAQVQNPEIVIIGEEILTTGGEILAAYVTKEIPSMLTPLETVERLKDQGAFISVSHPFDSMRKGGWRLNDLLTILPYVDAIETYNSRCVRPAFNRRAKEFATAKNIPGTVGSDAHTAFEVGRSLLLLDPFDGPEGMRRSIRNGSHLTKWSPPWIHLSSRYAVLYKKITLLDIKKQA